MDVVSDARASLVTKWGRGLLKKGIYPVICWQQFFSTTLVQDPLEQCILLSVHIVLFGFKCAGVTVSLTFTVAWLTSYYLKIVPQTALPPPGLQSPPVPGFCASSCSAAGALHLAKLPKCSIKSSHTLLFHSWPSRYSFDLQQNKFAEKAFSCLDLVYIPKNFCKANNFSSLHWLVLLKSKRLLYFKWQVEFQITN